ncbi:5-formyltetrahydrofolate cyclo-ligase [Actinomycetospora sp. TBRC 11914]|uniref:5-formyltetrahydrofolate cyclo-ligase n=1 Tax=Actinomycetospora sp. TBRC 11914 TaxID=2729387 RepID=UPI00145EB223|nr:5-formyltetrahydrofolate cyclo-ligase [Actinomycetospora sp. TBRC 11914]NMO90850.1 5-formyltetrahydrofolate cyclo-ligase [Actinomycetospora sp. TBRC 11914]
MTETERSGARPSGKDEVRRELLARRRERPDDARRHDASALAAGLPWVLDELGADPRRPVCLHVPVRREPGAAPDGAVPLLDAAVALGRRVLLPVTVGDAPLDWAPFGGREDLVPGPHGLLEPGRPRLGPTAIGEAAVVVVPALAATADGVRLGRGGGHYDRSLPLRSPTTVVVALVGDDELLAELPAEPHDVRVDAVWRPHAGLLRTAGADASPGTP